MNQTILIVDFGGPQAQMLARRVREHSVYCEVAPRQKATAAVKARPPAGAILAPRAADEGETQARALAGLLKELGVPVLDGAQAEAGPHLRDFLYDTCGCTGQWTTARFVEDAVKTVRETVGGGRVLCALSGGVDSTVCALLVHRAVGAALHCVFVDHGLMRKDEGDQVMQTLAERFKLNVTRVNAGPRFLAKLAGVTDPEQKRKIIGGEFIEVFTEVAQKLGSMDYLLQGTIYPDIIESGEDGMALVKSHHNVGGLPEKLGFKLLEPLRLLFKDEVRRVGAQLGIPESLVWRQPFPGPGLAVRCLGEVTEEKLFIVRESDAILREEIAEAGLEREIWQYFTVLPNLRSVGVQGGERTYAHAVGIRAVTSTDAMSGDWARIPYEVLSRISSRITSEVPGVNRVLLDCTPKPPGTIEWE